MEESADQRGALDAAQILPAPRPHWGLSQTEPPAPRDPSECAYRIDVSPKSHVCLLLLRANDTDAEEREE